MGSFNWINNDEIFEQKRNAVKEELSRKCNELITNGFYHRLGTNNFFFSYNEDNQINFQDTMRLFENNMIETTIMNTYLNGIKRRITVSKVSFTNIYLAGVKHKNNLMIKYNDVLLPALNKITTTEELENFNWNSIPMTSAFNLKTNDTLPTRVDNLARSNQSTMLALVQLYSIIPTTDETPTGETPAQVNPFTF